MLNHFIHYLETHMAQCFYQRVLGIPCPGCGMQRSLIELLKGHLWESLSLYPALLPTLGMITFLLLHLVFRFKRGGDILKYLFIGNIAIILFHYIYVLITLKR